MLCLKFYVITSLNYMICLNRKVLTLRSIFESWCCSIGSFLRSIFFVFTFNGNGIVWVFFQLVVFDDSFNNLSFVMFFLTSQLKLSFKKIIESPRKIEEGTTERMNVSVLDNFISMVQQLNWSIQPIIC